MTLAPAPVSLWLLFNQICNCGPNNIPNAYPYVKLNLKHEDIMFHISIVLLEATVFYSLANNTKVVM